VEPTSAARAPAAATTSSAARSNLAPARTTAARTTRRWPRVAGLATTALLVLGALLGAVRLPAEASARPEHDPQAPASPGAAVPPPAAPPTRTTTLTLLTEPPGATVTDGSTGARLGFTPLRLDVRADAATLSLAFDLTGYARQLRTLRPDVNQRLELTMAKTVRATPKRPRALIDGVIDPY
jgi:hypothetical protein